MSPSRNVPSNDFFDPTQQRQPTHRPFESYSAGSTVPQYHPNPPYHPGTGYEQEQDDDNSYSVAHPSAAHADTRSASIVDHGSYNATDERRHPHSYPQRHSPSRSPSIDSTVKFRMPLTKLEEGEGKESREPDSIVSQLVKRSLDKIHPKRVPNVPSKLQRTLTGDSDGDGLLGTSVAMVKTARDTVFFRREQKPSEIVDNVECELQCIHSFFPP